MRNSILNWDFLLPEQTGAHTSQFKRCLTPPEDGVRLTLRCTFRWSTKGESVWSLPRIEAVEVPDSPGLVKIAVVTGRMDSRRGPFQAIADNLSFYLPLCEAACRERPALIVLPEIALQWGIDGSPIDLAVPAPGPETEAFAEIARRHNVRILLGMLERDSDAVHNSAVLIGPNGDIDGRYRKVHLAVGGEIETGILPGDSFPVFETEVGRVGCNICMDSSATESSRMVGLNGADLLLLPIMGDHRAWHPGEHIFDPARFLAIMRTRAMDNQLCMVVAVNRTEGSCIIDRLGNVLAWNDGDQDFIHATVNFSDGYRPSSKGCFRGINWMQRRPHVYQTFVEANNTGALLTSRY
jgi:predicted amidohydrolase